MHDGHKAKATSSVVQSELERFDVLGTSFSALNLTTAVAQIGALIDSENKGYVTISNVDGVVKALGDARLQAVYNGSFLTTPDGMPIVWLGRARSLRQIQRVYGPDLMLRLFAEGRRKGWKHYFYGGKPGVAEKLQARMQERFAGAQIVGSYCPPFRALNESERAELIADVARTRPDIIWVGISTPKQDFFMQEMVDVLDCSVIIGVGAAFDFHAGVQRQAPLWMQDAGLEWLYRLGREPKRLGARYASIIPQFCLQLLLQTLGLAKARNHRFHNCPP